MPAAPLWRESPWLLALYIAVADEQGIACCVSAWRRLADDVMPPRVKAGANYQQSRLVVVQATVDGYAGAIILNGQGRSRKGRGRA